MINIEKEELENLYKKLGSANKVSKQMDISIQTVLRNLKKFQIKQNIITRYSYNEKIFLNENSISYYLLGVFLTDGCLQRKTKFGKAFVASLVSKDREWILSIKNKISNNLPLVKDKRGYWFFRICSESICNWLLQNECVPRKSLTLKFPNIPQKYIWHFLRGVVDGDGSITCRGKIKTINICSASQQFINSIGEILKANNINYSIIDDYKNKNNSVYKIIMSGRYAYKFSKYIYKNKQLYLKRKYDIAKNIIIHFENKGLSLQNINTFNFYLGKNNPNYHHELSAPPPPDDPPSNPPPEDPLS